MLQCDALDGLFVANVAIFAMTLVLLLGKLSAALWSVAWGTAEIRRLRAAGAEPQPPAPDASIEEHLHNPLSRRAVGLADTSAMSAIFVPFIMSHDDVLRCEDVEEMYRRRRAAPRSNLHKVRHKPYDLAYARCIAHHASALRSNDPIRCDAMQSHAI